MRRLSIPAFAIAAIALAAAGAAAQTPGTRLRGEVEAVAGAAMTLKTPEGRELKVALAPGYSVGGVVPAKASDIAKGGFVGVGAGRSRTGRCSRCRSSSSRRRCAARARGTGPGACSRMRR